MHEIDLRAVDLNLVVALEALLETRSVTRAARRLGRTQSGTSHALARLRVLLGDPVLVRSGRGLVPTPRAEAMIEPLRRVLHDVTRLIGDAGDFEPRTSTRSFTIAAPDVMALLVPELLARFAAEAPGVRIELLEPGDPTVDLTSGRAELVLAGGRAEAPGLIRRGLGRAVHAVVRRRGHPLTELTVEGYVGYPHVLVRTEAADASLVGAAVRAAGLERSIGLVVPGFLLAPHVVARSDLLFTTARPLVRPLAEPLGLVVAPPPIPIPDIPVAALWHERLHADPGHRWLREHVAAVVSEALTSEVPPVR